MKAERIEGSEPYALLNTIGGRMRWSVLWVKKGSIIRHRCGSDLDEAIRIYTLAKSKGRQSVTLRCDNTGFPPPKKYQPHSVYVKKGRRRVVVDRVPMDLANRKGIYWCPYCREFRRFQIQDGFYYEDVWVPEPDKRGGLYCPMCGASHRDTHVRRWNPIANRHFLSGNTGRRTRRRR